MWFVTPQLSKPSSTLSTHPIVVELTCKPCQEKGIKDVCAHRAIPTWLESNDDLTRSIFGE